MTAHPRTRTFLVMATGLFLTAGITGCHAGGGSVGGQEPAPTAGANIRVGVKNNQPGLSELPEGGNTAQGFEPQLASALLGSRLTQTVVDSSSWEEDLLDNRIDVAISSITVSDERLKHVIFAGPYITTRLGALELPKHNAPKSNLTGQKICYVRNTTTEELLKQKQAKDASIQLLDESNSEKCLAKVSSGAVDIFVSDAVILLGLEYNRHASHYAFVPESDLPDIKPQNYGIALRPQDKALCLELDAKIDKMLVQTADWDKSFSDTVTDGKFGADQDKEYRPTKTDHAYCS